MACQILKIQDLEIQDLASVSNIENLRLEYSRFGLPNMKIQDIPDLVCQVLKIQDLACQILKIQDLAIQD